MATVDIFECIGHIQKGDRDFFDNLSEEEKKGFQPFVVQRWLTGSATELPLMMVDEACNRYTFTLGAHKQLLYQLLVVAAGGTRYRPCWPKPQSKTVSLPLTCKVLQQHYKCSIDEAIDYCGLLSVDRIVEMAQDLGWQKDDITKLKKEYPK